MAEADLSPRMGTANAPGSNRHCGHFRTGDRRAGVRRNPSSEDHHAKKRSGSACVLAAAWSVSEQAGNSKRYETCSLSRTSICEKESRVVAESFCQSEKAIGRNEAGFCGTR